MCTHSPYQIDHQSETNCDFNITLWSSNNFQRKIWMHCVYKDDLNWLFSIIQSSILADNFLIAWNHRANSTLLTHQIRFIRGLFFIFASSLSVCVRSKNIHLRSIIPFKSISISNDFNKTQWPFSYDSLQTVYIHYQQCNCDKTIL